MFSACCKIIHRVIYKLTNILNQLLTSLNNLQQPPIYVFICLYKRKKILDQQYVQRKLQNYLKSHSLTYKYIELVAYFFQLLVTAASLYGHRFISLYICTFVSSCSFIFKCMCICVVVYLSISMPPFRKHYHSVTPMASTVLSSTTLNYTPTKKSYVAPPMPIKGRTAVIIARAITEISHPLSVYFQPSLVKFPPLTRSSRYRVILIFSNT